MAAPRVAISLIPFVGYDRGLLRGIARYAQLHGPWVLYLSAERLSGQGAGTFNEPEFDSKPVVSPPLPDLRQWQATGVIARIQSAAVAQKILASGLPTVTIDLSAKQLERKNRLSQLSEIRAESPEAGRLGAEHFLERGFRHFAFCGYAGHMWSQERQESYCERLAKAGFSCDVFQPPQRKRRLPWKTEQPMVVSWLQSLPRPVAIMACNDVRGRQILEAALMQGLSVPDDVAVVGVDDDQLICNLANPPLSSVAFNLEQAGYHGAELLDGLMSGRVRKAQRIIVPALWVVPRRSTDVIATDDDHLSTALRFVRDNARQSITVDDVVEQAGPSRRGLEIRFRRLLGRSIRSEIERVRLTFAKQLLRETQLPVQRIAALVGFSSVQYLGNVFRRETSMTMGQFRRRARMP